MTAKLFLLHVCFIIFRALGYPVLLINCRCQVTENEPRFSLTANGTNSRPTGSYIALLVDPKAPAKEEDEDPVQVLHYLKHDLAMTAASAYLNGNTQPLARYQRLAPVGDESELRQ